MEALEGESISDLYLSSNSSVYSNITGNWSDDDGIGDVYNLTSISDDFWEVFNEKNLRQSWVWSMVLTVAYFIVFIIGLTGNALVMVVIFLKHGMKTVTNMFIFNLACADMLVITFCVPPTFLSNLLIPWILGSFMCKGVAYVQGVAVCASAYSLAAISLDRCIAIYQPVGQQRGISKRQAFAVILLIWTFSLTVTIPWIFAFELMHPDGDGQIYCVEAWRNPLLGKLYYIFTILFGCFVIPLALIITSNVAIWYRVSKRKIPNDSSLIRNVHRRTRRIVRKSLGVVTSAFLICWVPLYVLATIRKFVDIENLGYWGETIISFLFPLVQWMGSFNSSLNPVLYAFTNAKYQRTLRVLFCCANKSTLNNTRETRAQTRTKRTRQSGNSTCSTKTRLGTSKRDVRSFVTAV